MKTIKKGDKVKLKEGLITGEWYNGMLMNGAMRFDDILKIKVVDGCAEDTCLLENGYYYGFDMLTKAE